MNICKIASPALLLLLAACKGPKTKNEQTNKTETTTVVTPSDTTVGIPTPAPATGAGDCYSSKTGNSIVEMALTIKGGIVTGTLNYLPEAKDKNTGTLSGSMRGDTLLADYTFMSEGVESVREVVFLKTARGYKEGYGAVRDQAGKMIFEDLKQIDFSKSTELVKVDCDSGKL